MKKNKLFTEEKKKRQKNQIVYDSQLWTECGFKQLSNCNFKEARVCFNNANAVHRNKMKTAKKKISYIHPYFGIGLTYLTELNYIKAEEYFKECLNQDPNFFYASRKLAELYTELLNKNLILFSEKQEEFQKISEERGINMKEEIMNEIKKYTALSMEWLTKTKELEDKLGVNKNMVDLQKIVTQILEKK